MRDDSPCTQNEMHYWADHDGQPVDEEKEIYFKLCLNTRNAQLRSGDSPLMSRNRLGNKGAIREWSDERGLAAAPRVGATGPGMSNDQDTQRKTIRRFSIHTV